MVLLFFSCKKVEEVDLDQPAATCTVDGNSFIASNFDASVNELDMININLSDNVYDISIRIYNFSEKNVNEVVYFSVPGMGIVTHNDITY